VRRATPYRDLTRKEYDDVVQMLAEGYSTKRGRRAAYLHYDGVNRRLKARRGARLAALTSGGAIPDLGDYRVILEPTELFVGTQRGLRDRIVARGHLPARQRVVSDHQGRVGTGAGGGRRRPAADDSV